MEISVCGGYLLPSCKRYWFKIVRNYLDTTYVANLTAKILTKLRAKLLDLTLRNRLLNFKYSPKSVVRVVDEIPCILFSKLTAGSSLIFRPVPDPKFENYEDEITLSFNDGDEKGQPVKKRPPVERYAVTIGIDPSFTLKPRQNGRNKPSHNDNLIQTLLYPDDLEQVMGRIHNLYRTALEETGNNLLYLGGVAPNSTGHFLYDRGSALCSFKSM